MRDADGEHQITCEHDTWVRGITAWNLTRPPVPTSVVHRPVAASGAWTAADTYEMRLCYPETPILLTLVCRFAAGKVTLKYGLNVSFGPTEFPQLIGRLAATP